MYFSVSVKDHVNEFFFSSIEESAFFNWSTLAALFSESSTEKKANIVLATIHFQVLRLRTLKINIIANKIT